MTADTSTHYDTLHIDRQATAQAVRRAWQSLAQTHHPDRDAGQHADADMARINQAYAVLSDPISRTHYDRALAQSEGRTSPTRSVRYGTTQRMAPLAAWLLSGVVTLALLGAGYAGWRLLAAGPEAATAASAADDSAPLQLVPEQRLRSRVHGASTR